MFILNIILTIFYFNSMVYNVLYKYCTIIIPMHYFCAYLRSPETKSPHQSTFIIASQPSNSDIPSPNVPYTSNSYPCGKVKYGASPKYHQYQNCSYSLYHIFSFYTNLFHYSIQKVQLFVRMNIDLTADKSPIIL